LSWINLALIFFTLLLTVLVLPNYQIVGLLLLLGLSLWILLNAKSEEHWKWLFVVAAILGTSGELYCVYGSWPPDGDGLYNYHFPRVLGLQIPIWLPFVWGNLFVLFVGFSSKLTPSTGETQNNAFSKIVKYSVMLLILSYAGFLYGTVKYSIRYAMTPLLAFVFAFWNQSRDLLIFFIAGLGGTLAEILAMRFGLWSYTYPMFSNWITEWLSVPGLPVSLTMAWGLSCLVINRFALNLNRFFVEGTGN